MLHTKGTGVRWQQRHVPALSMTEMLVASNFSDYSPITVLRHCMLYGLLRRVGKLLGIKIVDELSTANVIISLLTLETHLYSYWVLSNL